MDHGVPKRLPTFANHWATVMRVCSYQHDSISLFSKLKYIIYKQQKEAFFYIINY